MRRDKSEYYLQAVKELTGEPVKTLSTDENNEITSIVFRNENVSEPSHSDIKAKAQEMAEAKYYVDDRVKEYPSIQEQLDMQYWDSVNGTTTWKDAIAQVKADNPKN